MAEKSESSLSITIRAVDRTTSVVKRVNESLEKTFKPFRDMRKQFGDLSENLGLPKIADGFRGIAGMAKQLASHVGVAAGVVVAAATGFKSIVDSADELGDTAEKVGLSVDALAQLRDAAARTGSSAKELDDGMMSLSRGLGQARAGAGKLKGFIERVSPPLLLQLKAAKSNEEAFGLMADAMAKVKDPAKRAALATAAFGGSGAGLAPLLAKGSGEIAKMGQQYTKLAGPQKQAVDEAGKIDEAFHDLRGAADGVKASLIVGLGPAFRDVTARATEFLTNNRGSIQEWIKDFGEKLPGRINSVIDTVKGLISSIKSVTDAVGGAGSAIKILIAAWAGLKALQLAGHLAGIARGFYGIAKGAAAARAATAASGAAAAAASAGGAAKAAARGGKLAAGGAAAAAGPLGIIIAGGLVLDEIGQSIDRPIRERNASRGAQLNDILSSVRAEKDEFARRDLIQSLRDGGFVDGDGFKKSSENMAALAGGQFLEMGTVGGSGGFFGPGTGFANRAEGRRQIDEINKLIRESGKLEGPRDLSDAEKAEQQLTQAQAQISVVFENAPRGMRVSADPQNTVDVDLSVGSNLLPGAW